MAKVIIRNNGAFDGEYPLEDIPLTGHEAHLLKQVAGIRLGELRDAMASGDNDVIICFAVIAMWRAGKVDKETSVAATDLLLSSPIGSIDLDLGTDALPPDHTTAEKASESSTSNSNGSGKATDASTETTLSHAGSLG